MMAVIGCSCLTAWYQSLGKIGWIVVLNFVPSGILKVGIDGMFSVISVSLPVRACGSLFHLLAYGIVQVFGLQLVNE
jgi:hypothetical protein